MNQSSDEDEDSLFGSPPPSPARGRSPSQESLIQGEGVSPMIAAPSGGVRRKNVGTIALPGSHMSCAELPADLPALGLSLPKSSHDSPCTASPGSVGIPTSIHTQAAKAHSASRLVRSRAPSAVSTIPSSAFIKKRRTSNTKSRTPTSPAPPIALPGPNEPTPPNFLRSQSSLLGLAGLVGSVKPSRLYTHGPTTTQQCLPRGSTPTYPIVVDDDQDTLPTERPRGQDQLPQRLDQLDPDVLRSNIVNSLTKEKNIFPVLESLIKLFGVEPHTPSAGPPPQPFARPYGHGIFNVQSTLPASPISPPCDSTTPIVPPPKRRKLKHVPAGAADWDIPFPFAAGEGPKGYQNTWAQDRAKQLMTQLLELVHNATKRATIKTARNRGKPSEGRTRAQNRQPSRSVSVETQLTNSMRICEPSHAGSNVEGTVTPADSLSDSLQPLGVTGLPCLDSKVRASEITVEESGSVAPCDLAAFEEWLAQLQEFVPVDTNASTPESDWARRSSLPSDSTFTPEIHSPTQYDPLSALMPDDAIDPTLLAMSQLGGSAPRQHFPNTDQTASGDISQVLDMCSPSTLTHSPRTSSSSLTEPLTPSSEAFADVQMGAIAHQDYDHDPRISQLMERDPPLQSLLTELFEPLSIKAAQKAKAGADMSVAPATPSTLDQSLPGVVSGVFDKQAILERARERRRQLVAEIERAKLELWETSMENAVLVHLTRNESLGS